MRTTAYLLAVFILASLPLPITPNISSSPETISSIPEDYVG